MVRSQKGQAGSVIPRAPCATSASISVIIRGDAGTYTPEQFEDISLDVPTLLVDTSDGYQPETREITSFIRAR
ncbi:hypothetical protein [Streptomyces goshikiensis]|uniref:hypothetical protein n=1 Tax=Streptomyces goshikiensis TaxID=1942 RepID=UPI0037B185B2